MQEALKIGLVKPKKGMPTKKPFINNVTEREAGNPARRCRFVYFFECDSKSNYITYMLVKGCKVGQ